MLPNINQGVDRVAILARVSSEDQADRDTIEVQIDFANKYCDLHKLIIYDLYKDDGVTGTIPLEERPEGKRLLEDARAGKFKLVLIYNLKRLGRRARVVLNAVHELEQYGVHVRSMTEPFDTSDASGRFLLTVLAGVAELDRENLLETMWHGANRAARQGKWLGGIVPYGYFVNDGKFLEVNENPIPNSGMEISEVGVIKLIYNLIADKGYSTIKTADYLNALSIPPSYAKDGRMLKRGKRKVNVAGIWRPGAVRRIVINTTYKGIHYYGKRGTRAKELIEREVPAIVSVEQWERAQSVLKENQIEAFRNTKHTRYLLRGLIKCGTCGLNYHGITYNNSNNKGKTLRYYICGGKNKYHGKVLGKCTSKNLPANWVEELVWQSCKDFINNPGSTLIELKKAYDEASATATIEENYEEGLENLKQSLREKEIQKHNILDLYRKNLISGLDVEKQLVKITDESNRLETLMRELEKEEKKDVNVSRYITDIETLLSELRGKINGDISFEVKREIVKKLVKEIIVKPIPENLDEDSKIKHIVEVLFFFDKFKVDVHTGTD